MIIFYSGYGRAFPEVQIPDAAVMLSYWTSVHSKKNGKVERRMTDLLAAKKAKRLKKTKAKKRTNSKGDQ